MPVFDPQSRYVNNAEIYQVTDRRGRTVAALTAAKPPVLTELGEHLRNQGQRLDHLANFYMADPNGYWRIAEINQAMLPDALAEVLTLKIPTEL